MSFEIGSLQMFCHTGHIYMVLLRCAVLNVTLVLFCVQIFSHTGHTCMAFPHCVLHNAFLNLIGFEIY